jgi:pimeloyl-ACP methyl ester carboxylesterase
LGELERNEVSLYYESNGRGPALLLTHGFAGSSLMWRGQVGTLSKAHELITWDLRGHGRSDCPEDPCAYALDETLSDMKALLDALGHERAIIGGHSLGGYLSLAFYMKYPERVRGLLIIDTGPGYKSDPPRDEWNEMAKGLARRLERDGLSHLQKLSREMDPSEHRSAIGLAMAARGMLVQRDSAVIDSLSKIDVPTLVLVGEKDRSYLAASKYMTDKIPGAEQIVIPDAGHAVNHHQPERFNAALESFLARIG